MAVKSGWVRKRIECPEGLGLTELLVEWQAAGHEKTVNGITCKNPGLRDLSGRECRWSCWDSLAEREE